jgi:serine/threonine protein kinase
VWEAKQLSLNRLVAVKVDRRTLETDAEQRRFLREAGAAGRMSGHPGIVTVHDAGILTDDRPYLVMALCEGGSLTKWVKASRGRARRRSARSASGSPTRWPPPTPAACCHRDVKPANILIDSYGHVGLADFGLAALPDPGMELSETLEAITPAYAPPEVFHRRPPTAAGDVYSLGPPCTRSCPDGRRTGRRTVRRTSSTSSSGWRTRSSGSRASTTSSWTPCWPQWRSTRLIVRRPMSSATG